MKFLALAAGPAWLLIVGSAIAVVLLYLLKPSPRRLVIASSLIWQRVLRERKRKSERLRWWISLLLALCIALAVAFALTRPEIAAVSGTAEDRVVVIDNSSSMAVRNSDGSTRLQKAIDRAGEIVRAGGAGSRFLITDTMRQLPAAGFEPRATALARLRSIESRAGTPRIPEAGFALAQDGTASEPGNAAASTAKPLRVWLVTDGVAPLQPPAGTQVISVFQPAPNVGITAFDVRALPGDPRRHEVFIEVTNAAPASAQVEVLLSGMGKTPVSRVLRVAGNATSSLVLDVSGFSEGPLRAAVRADADAFDLDDTAYAYLPAKGRVRLALVTPGNTDLARALRLLPHVEVEVVSPARVREPGRFDAAIFDRETPSQAPRVPALLIAPALLPWLAARTDEVSDTRVEHWDATHPLLSGVPLRDVLIDRATPLRTAGESIQRTDRTITGRADITTSLEVGGMARAMALTAVARGPDNEALILVTQKGRRFVVLSFALDASNFALQPGFPGFLANTVDWLTREPRAQIQPLGLVRLPLSDARVLDFDGQVVPTTEVSEATLFDAARPGFYTAVARDQRSRIAVNLLDSRVTAINVSRLKPTDPPAAASEWTPGMPDPWTLLLLAAVALLAVEWWTYHRRLTV